MTNIRDSSTPRGEVLEEARVLTEGARNATHGDPTINLTRCASMINATFGTGFDATDIGLIYTLMKVARVVTGDKSHRDSYVDMAAYAAIAWECQEASDHPHGKAVMPGAWRKSTPLRAERRKLDLGVTSRDGYSEVDLDWRRGSDPGAISDPEPSEKTASAGGRRGPRTNPESGPESDPGYDRNR